jgi:5-methylcytosine-specific restriction endonuclease McrA
MPWDKTPADRRRDAATYQDPEYRRNRPLAIKRAGGRCELITSGRRCGSTDRTSVDHIIPVTQGGTHHLDNLRVLCKPHHLQKTAQEGKGYRKPGRRTPRKDPVLVTRTKW